ncbi:MAG: GNAT family N-acetyltransferase [Bacillota bacterium]
MIGYAIFNQYWQQGYAKEAVESMIRIGFDELGYHRLEAHINLDNEISKKAILSAGFHCEGIRGKYIRDDDAWSDYEVYILINPEN